MGITEVNGKMMGGDIVEDKICEIDEIFYIQRLIYTADYNNNDDGEGCMSDKNKM